MAGMLVARTCASVVSAGSGADDAAASGLVATVRVGRSRMIAKAATTAKMRTPAMSERRPSRGAAASRSGRLLWFAELVVRRVRRRAGLIGGVSIAALPGAASERVGAGVQASASSSNGSRSSSAVSSSAFAGEALSGSRERAVACAAWRCWSASSTSVSCCVAAGWVLAGSNGASSSSACSRSRRSGTSRSAVGRLLSASARSRRATYSCWGRVTVTCCEGAHGASSATGAAVISCSGVGSAGETGAGLRCGGRLDGPRRRLLDGIAAGRLPGYLTYVVLQLVGCVD